MAGRCRALFTFVLFAGAASAQSTPFTISNLNLSGTITAAGQLSGTGTATVSGLASGSVAITIASLAPPPDCAVPIIFSETFTFDSSDSLTLSEDLPNCPDLPPSFTVTTDFIVAGGTGIYSGRAGSGTITLAIQTTPGQTGAGPFTITGNGSGTVAVQLPTNPFTISNLSFTGTSNSAGVVSGTGTATLSLPASPGAFTETGIINIPCGGAIALSQTFTFNGNDSLTLSEVFPANCTNSTFTVTTGFNISGTGVYSGRSGTGTVTFTIQSNQVNSVGPFTGTGSGSGTILAQVPTVTPAGIVPVYSTVPTVQPGEWVSIYGNGLATSTATWNGNFPISLSGTSVTIDGNPAYLWFVSPTQINLQAPADAKTGSVPVVVTTPSGTFTSTVTLAAIAPSFSLLDGKHVTGIILRSNGSGADGGGTYDILGPTGSSLGYPTVAAKAGDSVVLFAVGLGPTNPPVAPGQLYSSAAATVTPVNVLINNNVSVTPSFAGLSSAGLYQINLTIPANLGKGDLSLQASVGGQQTQAGVVISLQ